MSSPSTISDSGKKSSPENPLLNFGFNLILPTLILFKAEGWFDLEPATVLVCALLFPVGYFFWDLYSRRKVNAISILGFVSVLLTGGIGLLELPSAWVAIKEATVPLLIGVVVMLSIPFGKPLVGVLLLNDAIIRRDAVERALSEHNKQEAFATVVRRTTVWLGISFLLSALLNLMLAMWIIQSPSGTTAFNDEIARLTLWSYPVIVGPCFIIMAICLWVLLSRLQQMTGLSLEALMTNAPASADKETK